MENSKPKSSVSEIVTAVANVILAFGLILTLWQIKILKDQISDDNKHSKQLVTLEAVRKWNESQPPNAAQCIKLMSFLTDEEFKTVLERKPLTLTKENKEHADKCLSAKNDSGLIKGYKLSKQGSETIANRVMTSLNADEAVMIAYQYDIGDKDILREQFKNPIAEDEKKIVEKLSKMRGHSEAYPAINNFLKGENKKDCAQK